MSKVITMDISDLLDQYSLDQPYLDRTSLRALSQDLLEHRPVDKYIDSVAKLESLTINKDNIDPQWIVFELIDSLETDLQEQILSFTDYVISTNTAKVSWLGKADILYAKID